MLAFRSSSLNTLSISVARRLKLYMALSLRTKWTSFVRRAQNNPYVPIEINTELLIYPNKLVSKDVQRC